MKAARNILCALWLASCTPRPAVAQIEKQAQTYDMAPEDCLAATFQKYPEIQRLRTDVERAAGTKLVLRSRALPQLFGAADVGVRGGTLYSPTGLYGTFSGLLTQPLIDVGIPPTFRRGSL